MIAYGGTGQYRLHHWFVAYYEGHLIIFSRQAIDDIRSSYRSHSSLPFRTVEHAHLLAQKWMNLDKQQMISFARCPSVDNAEPDLLRRQIATSASNAEPDFHRSFSGLPLLASKKHYRHRWLHICGRRSRSTFSFSIIKYDIESRISELPKASLQ